MSERSNPSDHHPTTPGEIFKKFLADNPDASREEQLRVARALGGRVLRPSPQRRPARPTEAARGETPQDQNEVVIDLKEVPPAPERKPHLKLTKRGKVVATLAALAATASGTAIAVTPGSEQQKYCADTTHAVVNGGTSLTQAADAMAEDRAYVIGPERLLRDNSQVEELGTGEKLDLPDTIEAASELLNNSGDRFCFVVPAPIAYGQQETDGTTTLAQLSESIGQSVQVLHSLNADRVPQDDAAPIPKGTVIWLDTTLDTSLILRRYTDQKRLSDLTHGDRQATEALLMANVFRFMEQDAINLTAGNEYMLPYTDADITPAMRELGITPADILKAYANRFTYNTRNTPMPEPAAKPTSQPEAAPTPGHISDKQREMIANLNLKPEQKEFVAKAVDAIMQARPYAEEHHINITVMLAQAILESGFGTSDKARLNNFFGMKVQEGDGWTGKNTGPLYVDGPNNPPSVFRVYLTMQDGFKGYIDVISSDKKPWYDDAQANYKDVHAYLAGLLNSNPQAGEYAYAEDPNYAPKILGLIGQLSLENLLYLNDQALAGTTPTRAQQPEQTTTGNIILDPKRYKDNPRQSELPPNHSPGNAAEHKGPWLMYHGQPKLSNELTYAQRLELVEAALNGISVSADEFKKFQVVDVTAKIQATPELTNFHGTSQDPNKPNIQKTIKYFVWHFTATNTSATSYDGFKAATAMQNGNRNVGVQYYQDSNATVYHLTDNLTYHTLSWKQPNGAVIQYNRSSFGVEIGACEQAAITSQQYENAIYLSAQFLIYNKFINKETGVTDTVNRMIIGHHEANPGGHSDNPGIVMDQIRPEIIGLLVRLGYKA